MIDLAIYQALTSVGACSLQVSLPTTQMLGLRVAPIASVVMTSSSAYPGLKRQLCANNLADTVEQYKALGIKPRALLLGYVPSCELYSEIYKFKDSFPDCFLALDPVLGDNARLYSNLGNEVVQAISKLSKLVDFISPNLTEALLLAQAPLSEYAKLQHLTALLADEKAAALLKAMNLPKTTVVALKGFSLTSDTLLDGKGRNYFYCHDKLLKQDFNWQSMPLAKTSCRQISGTGDFFASILIGTWLKVADWAQALQAATELTELAVRVTFSNLEAMTNSIKIATKEDADRELELTLKSGLALHKVLPLVGQYFSEHFAKEKICTV